MTIHLKPLAFAALFVFAILSLGGCKDDSGSSNVKPNTEQANRYRQGGGHGAPPGVTGNQPAAANNTP